MVLVPMPAATIKVAGSGTPTRSDTAFPSELEREGLETATCMQLHHE